jgi:hypothetical protein
LNDLAYGDGLFVGVGEVGHVVTSADGTNWLSQTIDVPQIIGWPAGLYSVAYGAGWFVAVGEQSTVVASQDGSHWSPRDVLLGPFYSLTSVSYAGGSFVAVGNDGLVIQSGNVLAGSLGNARMTLEGLTLDLTGAAGQTYRIQANSGLDMPANWMDVGDVVLPQSGHATFTDSEAGLLPRRFYRTAALPTPQTP